MWVVALNIFNDKIYIFGDDDRQRALFSLFLEKGFNTAISSNCFSGENKKIKYSHCFNESKSFSGTDFLVFPIPVKKEMIDNIFPFAYKNNYLIGGLFDKELIDFCKYYGINYYDLYKSKTFVTNNAKITAEGAVFNAMHSSKITISGSKCLVIGYGNCGKKICSLLKCMKACIYVVENDMKSKSFHTQDLCLRSKCHNALFYENINDIKSIHKFDFIFNTAPSKVLTHNILEKLSKNTTIIDIASAPGGTDFDYCKKHGITAKLCPGIPGTYAPKSAAHIIFNEIVNLKREG